MRIMRILVPGAILVLSCILIAGSWRPNYVDDAYISFRHALRIGQEYSLAWNRGGPPVEGYSNPLWVFILSPFAAARVSLETPAFWLGAAWLTGSVLLVFAACASVSNSALLAFATALGFLLSPGVIQSSLMGLETPLYGFLMLLACTLYSVPFLNSSRSWLRILTLCLLSVTRFEGFVLALVVPMAGRLSAENRKLRILVLKETCAASLFVAMTFLLRRLVFRNWLPMPIHAKSTGLSLFMSMNILPFSSSYWTPSLRYMQDMCNAGILICLAALLVAAYVGLFLKQWRAQMSFTYPAAVLFTLVICVLNGGDWMPGFRLLTPALGCLFVGAIAVLHATGLLRRHKCLTLTFCAALVLIPLQDVSPGSFGRVRLDKTQKHPRMDAGNWMSRAIGSGELCVLETAGRISYAGADLRIVDFHGLVNEEIARLNVQGSHYGKRDDAAILRKCPALIQANSTNTMGYARDFFVRTGTADYDYLNVPAWANTYVMIRKDVARKRRFFLPTGDSTLIDMRQMEPYLANRFFRP